jgi:signal transduction histidine kinase
LPDKPGTSPLGQHLSQVGAQRVVAVDRGVQGRDGAAGQMGGCGGQAAGSAAGGGKPVEAKYFYGKYVADIETDFDAAMPPVPCHIGEINQVVLNLVVNAAHAIEAKGAGRGLITVTTRHAGGWAEIRLRDTGTGVAPDIAERIFDPFFTTKPQGKGSGQGLAISRSIVVKNHRGTLHMKSAPDEGTEFTVRLPLDPAKTADKEIAA